MASVGEKLVRVFQLVSSISRKRNAFDQLCGKILLAEVSACAKQATFSLEVTQEMCHWSGFLHSGLIATLMTSVTSVHGACVDLEGRQTSSVDINLSFTNSAGVGEVMKLDSSILKLGRSTCLAEMKIFGKDERLLACGRHSMMFTGKPNSGVHLQDHDGMTYL